MATQTVRHIPSEPQHVPNQYIVVFKPTTTHEVRAEHRAWAAERNFQNVSVQGHGQGTSGLLHTFNICDGALMGYCARVSEDLAKEIEETDEVDFVEPDYKVYALALTQQQSAPWGLARLSAGRKLTASSNNIYTYDDEAAGEGTYSYIIDTGILENHEEFEGRATFGYNAVRNSSNTDRNGHGTHVAGTIGSKSYGVAKKTQLIGVKVLGDSGEGTNATVIAGLQWALADAERRGVTKCVANMSLGGTFARALNTAVQAAYDRGLTMVVAAGNEGQNANRGSPSSEPTAITVGATAIDDTVPVWSNYGTRVDIFAPGVDIASTWIDESGGGSVTAINTISGTSMASPHICGLAAYLISKYPELDTPRKVTDRIVQLGVKGQIVPATLRGGSGNLLAHNGESQ
ncbi:peptidase S8/S53 domain-containing protein [Kalaharituber pfeilii]|nr:peptidase S8/S53 domain-containing protein [Kalaharituber pfeilii]